MNFQIRRYIWLSGWSVKVAIRTTTTITTKLSKNFICWEVMNTPNIPFCKVLSKSVIATGFDDRFFKLTIGFVDQLLSSNDENFDRYYSIRNPDLSQILPSEEPQNIHVSRKFSHRLNQRNLENIGIVSFWTTTCSSTFVRRKKNILNSLFEWQIPTSQMNTKKLMSQYYTKKKIVRNS